MIHKAEFLMPGVFLPEETVKVIGERNPAAAAAVAPESAYCFTLFDVEEPPDLGPDFKVVPVRKNVSGRYYLGGDLHDIKMVRALGHDILASNMEANGWRVVIQCRTGNWQPFTEDDEVLYPSLAVS